ANPNYSKTTIIHPGEQILIPLNTEQILSKDKNLDPSFIPLYYQIQPKEGLYRISLKFNRVPIPVLVKWNNIEFEDLIIKDRFLIIGYLKSDETNNSKNGEIFSSNIKMSNQPSNTVSEAAKIRTNKIQDNTHKEIPNGNNLNKAPEEYISKKPTLPQVNNPYNNNSINTPTNSNNSTLYSKNTIISSNLDSLSKEKKDTMSATANILSSDSIDGEGFFKPLFLVRQNEGHQFQTGDLMSGVFKNESGYQDKRYYALMVGVPVGQVIKITAPSTQKSIYVKVLGPLPENLRLKKIDICISSASAHQLGIKGESFIVQCLY
ncbi:MAG: hypothetical protein ACRC0A_05430, partial [Chitinophagaceae bacterium]